MKQDYPVRKTLVRVALITLVGGLVAGAAFAVFFPAAPIFFKLGLPAVSLMTAANLYALSNRPRGEYTRQTLKAFDRVYRPLKPLKNSTSEPVEPVDGPERGGPDTGRPS